MSAVTVLSPTVYGFTTPAGPQTAPLESGGVGHLEICNFACAFTGTYAQGTGYSIPAATIAATIAGVRRDGQTITVLDVMAAAPGLEANLTVDSGTVTFSGGIATGLLYANAAGLDESTEHPAGPMGTFACPLVFLVRFAAQANL